MKLLNKRLFPIFVSIAMVLTLIPAWIQPARAADYATGDIIAFGSYPQTQVTDLGLIANLNGQTLGVDSTVTFGGVRYKRLYFTEYTSCDTMLTPDASNSWQDDNGYFINTVYWFKIEPIQWRVLSENDGILLVMSEKLIDARAFNQEFTAVTWETCTLRQWLNGVFYNEAFNAAEQEKIFTTSLVNADNPWHGTSGGNDTTDKVFLLSYSEVLNPAYGFSADYLEDDAARRTQGTDYSKSRGLQVCTESPYPGNSKWLLRSPGFYENDAGNVYCSGFVNNDNNDVKDAGNGVRPVMRIEKPDITVKTITFGSYPQTRVTNERLIEVLNSQPLGADDTVTFRASKYKRVYFTGYTQVVNGPLSPSPEAGYQDDNGYFVNTVYWFKFEPVRWRVLSNNNGELLVLADKILDSKPYHNVKTSVTWETCDARTWLNESFYYEAFNADERALIKPSVLVNEDNPIYGTDAGNDTIDKIFLLSFNEMWNPAYGFIPMQPDPYAQDEAREGQGTDYAKCMNLWVNQDAFIGNSYWYLRSPARDQSDVGYCGTDGQVCTHGRGTVANTYIGTRPAMRVKLNYSTGDVITFGSYPQTEVTNPDLIANLNAQTLGEDSTVTYAGSKYLRVYYDQYIPWYTNGFPSPEGSFQDDNGYYVNTVYWFKYEPIQWRVLSNTDGELFVMAEKLLESREYHMEFGATWETCSMRVWLNDEFYHRAFSAVEQTKIAESEVINEDNPFFGTDGGNDTIDKLFLLSCSEVANSGYGFSSDYSEYDVARQANGTDFAKSKGLNNNLESSYSGNNIWWLRSPGDHPGSSAEASVVGADGDVFNYVDNLVYYTFIGVRPACRIRLGPILTAKAETTCVVDYQNMFIFGTTPGIQTLESYAQVLPGYQMAYETTAGGFGTGTIVNATLVGVPVESYALIIYGDVNGDGNIDTADAGLIVDYENYLINWDPVSESWRLQAADLNGDGNVDSSDAGLIVDYENFMLDIDQTTGLAT